MGVENHIHSELVAGFPDWLGDAGVTVGPCVTDVAGMIIDNEAAVHDPAEGIGTAMGSDDWKAWERVGDTVDRVVEIDGDRLNLW